MQKDADVNLRISPVNFEAYNRSEEGKTDRDGGEKARSGLSRMKRMGLLLTSTGSLVAVSSLALDLKDNVSSLMVGIGTVLFLIGALLYIKGE